MSTFGLKASASANKGFRSTHTISVSRFNEYINRLKDAGLYVDVPTTDGKTIKALPVVAPSDWNYNTLRNHLRYSHGVKVVVYKAAQVEPSSDLLQVNEALATGDIGKAVEIYKGGMDPKPAKK